MEPGKQGTRARWYPGFTHETEPTALAA
jgi:hypothetical protein